MDAEDWLKSVEKKLEIAIVLTVRVFFEAHQLFGTEID
jgi:hypothetical protein